MESKRQILHIDGVKVFGITPEFHGLGYANIQANLPRVQKRIKWSNEIKEDVLALVGYGPSLRKSIDLLKEYKSIMTMSGAHDYLIQHGIKPTMHIDCDPRPHKAIFTKNPQEGIEYLMSSSINPIAIDQLINYDLTLWNLETTEEFKYPEGEWVYPGMGSVGLQSMLIGHTKGWRKFTLFGMDSSFVKDGTHAGEHPRSKEQGKHMLIAIPNAETKQMEIFDTTLLFIVYAKEMYRWMTEVLTDCEFSVIGTGLFPAYLMYMNNNNAIKLEKAA